MTARAAPGDRCVYCGEEWGRCNNVTGAVYHLCIVPDASAGTNKVPIETELGSALSIWEVALIRDRYTTPENAAKCAEIERLAPIAIAHDVAALCGEIFRLRRTRG